MNGASAPKIDKGAHAEFMLRDLYVNDSPGDVTLFKYHNRAKIFTEAGVEEWAKVDIPYQTGWRVYAIKARVVFPDGSVTLLARDDVFTRQLFKDDKFEGNAKSFSFPGLKPGCIVEYKWTQARRYWVPSFFAALRGKYPTWHYKLKVNPFGGFAARIVPYNSLVGVTKKGGKFYLESKFQPAESDEPYQLPRKDFEPFIYMAYSSEMDALKPDEYWGYRGGTLVEIKKDFIRAKQKYVKQVASKIFEPSFSNDEKLRAAYDYCSTQITNIDAYTDKYTEEEIEELKQNDNPNDTIKRGYGTRYDINGVFASLASAAGFSAHLAEVENKQEYTYRERCDPSTEYVAAS